MQSILQSLPQWLHLTLITTPAIIATAALFLNIAQSRRTNTQSRATLVASCLKEFMGDTHIQNAFYSLEYGEFKYDGNFHGSDQEREIDKLLRHFANLALSWENGLLTIKDVKPIQYYLLRVMKNTEIMKYLKFMAEWSKDTNYGQHPYAALERLTAELLRHLP